MGLSLFDGLDPLSCTHERNFISRARFGRGTDKPSVGESPTNTRIGPPWFGSRIPPIPVAHQPVPRARGEARSNLRLAVLDFRFGLCFLEGTSSPPTGVPAQWPN